MGLDPYDLAYSQHLARSLRLYGSLASSAAAITGSFTTTTTPSQTTPSPTTSTTSTSTMTFTNNAYPDDYPYFWPLVFAYINTLIQRLYNTIYDEILVPTFRNLILPGSVVWVCYWIFIKFFDGAENYAVIRQWRALQANWRRDAEHTLFRIQFNTIRGHLTNYSSRAWGFVFNHWISAMIGCFVLWGVFNNPFYQPNPLDCRGMGFYIPDYMAWGKREQGSNHVGQYRQPGSGYDDRRVRMPLGEDGVFEKDYDDDRYEDWPVDRRSGGSESEEWPFESEIWMLPATAVVDDDDETLWTAGGVKAEGCETEGWLWGCRAQVPTATTTTEAVPTISTSTSTSAVPERKTTSSAEQHLVELITTPTSVESITSTLDTTRTESCKTRGWIWGCRDQASTATTTTEAIPTTSKSTSTSESTKAVSEKKTTSSAKQFLAELITTIKSAKSITSTAPVRVLEEDIPWTSRSKKNDVPEFITTPTTSQLPEVETTSSVTQVVVEEIRTTSTVESPVESIPALEGDFVGHDHGEREKHMAEPVEYELYGEDGLAWCSLCGQRHCCEIY